MCGDYIYSEFVLPGGLSSMSMVHKAIAQVIASSKRTRFLSFHQLGEKLDFI